MDERFAKINKLLSSYSLGQFDKKLKLSHRLDEVDAFISGVNMLGEELKATTISRNYFNNIFNSVSDMVFVLNGKGQIEKINQSVTRALGYTEQALLKQPLNFVVQTGTASFFNSVLKELKSSNDDVQVETILVAANGTTMPVLVSAAYLLNDQKERKGFLFTAKDITLQKQTENLIIRTITDTQEKERLRFAKDIHDSLGQQVSAIKFYIGTSVNLIKDEKQRQILLKSNDALVKVLADMRNICFNLMPKTLESFGLAEAIKELCNQSIAAEQLSFSIIGEDDLPPLEKPVQISVFRIVQEFINNAIKHGKATKVTIMYGRSDKHAIISLEDNGRGFVAGKVKSSGMGLKNVQSRVQSHNGSVQIISAPGKGTKYELTLPVFNTKTAVI